MTNVEMTALPRRNGSIYVNCWITLSPHFNHILISEQLCPHSTCCGNSSVLVLLFILLYYCALNGCYLKEMKFPVASHLIDRTVSNIYGPIPGPRKL